MTHSKRTREKGRIRKGIGLKRSSCPAHSGRTSPTLHNIVTLGVSAGRYTQSARGGCVAVQKLPKPWVGYGYCPSALPGYPGFPYNGGPHKRRSRLVRCPDIHRGCLLATSPRYVGTITAIPYQTYPYKIFTRALYQNAAGVAAAKGRPARPRPFQRRHSWA